MGGGEGVRASGGYRGIVQRGTAEAEELRPFEIKDRFGVGQFIEIKDLDQLDCAVLSLRKKETIGIPNPCVQSACHSSNSSITDQHIETCLITSGDGSRYIVGG